MRNNEITKHVMPAYTFNNFKRGRTTAPDKPMRNAGSYIDLDQ